MHVHTLRAGRPDLFFPLFISNGVLGVRDMGTPLAETLARIHSEIASGVRIGPRIVAAGPPLDGSVDTSCALSINSYLATPRDSRT